MFVYQLGYHGYEGSTLLYVTHTDRAYTQQEFDALTAEIAIGVAKARLDACPLEELPHLVYDLRWESLVCEVTERLVSSHGFARMVLQASALAAPFEHYNPTDPPLTNATSINARLREALCPLIAARGIHEARKAADEREMQEFLRDHPGLAD